MPEVMALVDGLRCKGEAAMEGREVRVSGMLSRRCRIAGPEMETASVGVACFFNVRMSAISM